MNETSPHILRGQMSQQTRGCPEYKDLGKKTQSPAALIAEAQKDIKKAKREKKKLATAEQHQEEEEEMQQGGFGFADLKRHASKLTSAVKTGTAGMRAALTKNTAGMRAALKQNTAGMRATLKKNATALVRKAPMSASALPPTNYLLWLGAGMSRVAYNSPLMMYAMLDALVSNEGNQQCLGTRFGSLSKAINAQGGNPFAPMHSLRLQVRDVLVVTRRWLTTGTSRI